MVTIRTIYSDIYKLCILPTECAHVLRVIIATGSPPVGRYAADIVKDIPLAALCCWLCVVFCRIISLPVSNSLCWYYLFTVTLCTPPPSCSSKIHVAIGLSSPYLSTFVQFLFPLFFFLFKRQRYCLVCISDLPGSNLDRNTDQLHSDFSCFSQSIQAKSATRYLWFNQDKFLIHAFQFLMTVISRLTLYTNVSCPAFCWTMIFRRTALGVLYRSTNVGSGLTMLKNIPNPLPPVFSSTNAIDSSFEPL